MAPHERDDLLGQLGAADDEVGQGDVLAVVLQGGAVDPRGEQPCGARHRDRGRGVPLVLAAGVHVGVGDVAGHRDDLDPGGAHRHQLGVELGREGLHEGRGPRAGDRDPGAGRGALGQGRGRPGVERLPERGLRHGTGGQVAVLPEGDVHGPVLARWLGELAGAVQGVHDPYPARGQPVDLVDAFVGTLLREHRVRWPVLGDQAHQQLVGGPVPGVLELLADQPLLADPEQQLTRHRGQPGRQDVVVGGRCVGRGAGFESHPDTLATGSPVRVGPSCPGTPRRTSSMLVILGLRGAPWEAKVRATGPRFLP